MAFLPFYLFRLFLPCPQAALFQGQKDTFPYNWLMDKATLGDATIELSFFFSGLPPLLSSLSSSNQGPRSRQGDGNHTCERGHQFVKTVEKLGAELNPCFHDPPTPMHQRSKTYLNNITWINNLRYGEGAGSNTVRVNNITKGYTTESDRD